MKKLFGFIGTVFLLTGVISCDSGEAKPFTLPEGATRPAEMVDDWTISYDGEFTNTGGTLRLMADGSFNDIEYDGTGVGIWFVVDHTITIWYYSNNVPEPTPGGSKMTGPVNDELTQMSGNYTNNAGAVIGTWQASR